MTSFLCLKSKQIIIIKNIKLEYKEYDLDENGNVIIPVMPEIQDE